MSKINNCGEHLGRDHHVVNRVLSLFNLTDIAWQGPEREGAATMSDGVDCAHLRSTWSLSVECACVVLAIPIMDVVDNMECTSTYLHLPYLLYTIALSRRCLPYFFQISPLENATGLYFISPNCLGDSFEASNVCALNH